MPDVRIVCRRMAHRRLSTVASIATLACSIGAAGAAWTLDVVAYDSRGHGQSDGETCTYGFHEKGDLRRILDTLAPGPVVLIGTSLGAAIALQAAADDARVSAVVAAEVFSDLETVARERAPFVFTDAAIRDAFRIAGARGRFDVAAVSPERAAGRLRIPVLLVHGTDDADTHPDHARRVFAQLRGPKRLRLVAGARHNGSLRADTWDDVQQWIDEALPRPADARPGDAPAPGSTRAH